VNNSVGLWQTRYVALPLKADVCDAKPNVCFVPEADMRGNDLCEQKNRREATKARLGN
jgi:hypothetical protein